MKGGLKGLKRGEGGAHVEAILAGPVSEAVLPVQPVLRLLVVNFYRTASASNNSSSRALQPFMGFETLAQLALAQCVWEALRCKHIRFVLPSASDNTSAESGLNKSFSTAELLGTFLRLAATWIHLHRVQFQVEHFAGKKNEWTDKLDRARDRARLEGGLEGDLKGNLKVHLNFDQIQHFKAQSV